MGIEGGRAMNCAPADACSAMRSPVIILEFAIFGEKNRDPWVAPADVSARFAGKCCAKCNAGAGTGVRKGRRL